MTTEAAVSSQELSIARINVSFIFLSLCFSNGACLAAEIGVKVIETLGVIDDAVMLREGVKDKSLSYICFEVLYWTGMREGELLALSPADIDLDNKTISINRTYQRIEGKDVFTSPKTRKSYDRF